MRYWRKGVGGTGRRIMIEEKRTEQITEQAIEQSTEQTVEKVLLVAVALGDEEETRESLEELAELVETAGAVAVGKVIQNREQFHPGTYVGKGKIDEIKELLWETDATGIVCDDELSPAQLRNLEAELDTKVMDRTLIILDIFAKRASTREGNLQVELAQLRYRAARLTGLGHSLSRLGGGIGTRGPGEKKLEMDRRLIKERISRLKAQLRDVERHREITRSQRTRNHAYVVAIVGYTNAGKSTLLNTLTSAGVLEEDQLFATLDPTTRNLELPGGQSILLTDTVGFIRKLPHHLIEAFKSTLEEAKYADLILHVVDASNPQAEKQMQIVYETLDQLEVQDKPVFTLYNKQDLVEKDLLLRDPRAKRVFKVSAKGGVGLDRVMEELENQVRAGKIYIEKIYDYGEAGKIQLIRKYGELLEEAYLEDGISVKGYIAPEYAERV